MPKKLTIEYVKAAIELIEGYQLISNDYINALSKLEILHKFCENIFEMNWHNFNHDHRCPKCSYKNRRGENNGNWNPNLTDEHREKGRNLHNTDRTEWRKAVYERDNHTCQCCGYSISGTLNAHHIDSWKDHKDDRFNVDNGVTLCETCHRDYHSIFGNGTAKHNSFYSWIIRKSVIKPENWLWCIQYPESMAARLKYFKNELL